MSRFTLFRRGNPCPLCQSSDGRCKEADTLLFCMSLTDAVTIPGYRFIGRTRNGTWGQWAEDQGDWSDTERQNWQRDQQRLRQQRLAHEQQRQANAMPVAERDRHYRKLLNALRLHPDDRDDLHQRGLTDDQIQAWGVKSVEQWQRLDFELPYTLAGVSLDGRSLNVAGAGYLCPITNADGQIVACQLRLREPGDSGRYRWLTSATKKRPYGATSHLPNGELPLAVHRPLNLQRQEIWLPEGTGAKPWITAQRLGVVAIGAAGGQFASSRVTLQETLARLTLEVDTRQIVDPIDAGAIQNPNVLRQLRVKWRLLTEWGYTVRIAWWGQITKADHDIDELANLSTIEYLTIAEFETLAAQYSGRGWQWLQRISQRLHRQPDPLRSAAALRQDLGEPESEVFTFQPGDRLKAYQTAIEQGHRYVLDRSVTGTGKSFDTGNLTPDLFGNDCRQIIYASDQHRNPTVETLSSANGWVDLEARHGGLVQETTPNGNTRWKRANGEVPNLPANCNRIQLIGALRAKHVSGADTASLICGGCPLREACSHAEGQNYGFLHRRRSALSATKLRAHPDSLPSTSDYDYEGVVLAVDEPGQIFQTKQTLTVTEQDLTQTITTLMHHPDLFTALQPLLTVLLSYLDGTERTQRYGMSHTEVLKQLINPAISIAEVEQALQPDLSYLNVTQQYGVDAADLPPSLRKRFAERDAEMANQTEQKIIKQWLPDLLRVLNGATGHLHLERWTLTISLPNTRQRAIFQAAQAAVFLDATLSREDLALKLGCQPSEIFVCHQAVPQYSNLTIAQVTDLGRLGMQRGAEQQRRSAAIVAHYQALDPATKVIDFKKHAAAGWGAWWRDSRGVNDFEQVSRLILIGTPCRNLADLLAEYAVLTGVTDAEDPGFQSFVDRAIRADMVQAIGRLRAHRRPDEPLEVIVLSDFDVGLPSIQRLKASEITLEAADRWECFTMAVQGAVTTLKATGKKVTQTEIAAISGYSQQYISRCWKLLQTLLEASNSKSSKNSDPPVASELVEVANAAIAECETVTQTIESVADIFWEWLEPGQQVCFWQSLTRSTQMQILEALLLMLPEPQIAFLNPKLTHAKGSET